MQRERNKIWFKISSNANRRQQHIHASSFQEKNLNIAISYCSFANFCKMKICPKSGLQFTLKLGWLKTNAGTNIRPQNDMYLSASEYTPLAKPFTSKTFTDSKLEIFSANFNQSATGFPCFLEILEIRKNQIISL